MNIAELFPLKVLPFNLISVVHRYKEPWSTQIGKAGLQTKTLMCVCVCVCLCAPATSAITTQIFISQEENTIQMPKLR